jgi:hypothetical protein
MARDVFISYQSSDKECADRVCEALERQNISCWIAPRDIPIGSEWAAAIVEGLQRCHSFVVILSSHSSNARQISREAELADNRKLPIFTLRIEDVQPPPGLLYFLGNVQWLDAFNGQFEAALGRLIEVIRQNAAYPAEATKLHRTIAAGAPGGTSSDPAAKPGDSAPGAPSFSGPRPVPGPPQARQNTTTIRMLAIAAICVALAFGGWLLARRPHPPAHEPSRMDTHPARFDGRSQSDESAARAAAERFINYRDSGDYPAAWREFTEQNQARAQEPRWTQRVEQYTKKYGQPTSHTIESCTPNTAGGMYTCTISARYEHNLSSEDKIVVAEERGGRWAIAASTRTTPK